jgi:hypothetical protein
MVTEVEIKILNKYFSNLPIISIPDNCSDTQVYRYWKNIFNEIIRIDLIKDYLVDQENKAMANADNFYISLSRLEKEGILGKIQLFINDNDLKFLTNEVYFLAFFYEMELDHTRLFTSMDIDNSALNYHQQRNKLIKVVNGLNIRHSYPEKEKTTFIESIVIRTSKPNDSISINNYELCYDIANVLREFLNIPIKFSDGKAPLNVVKRKNTKKSKSYFRRFIMNTYPLFPFFKNECNLQYATDKEYFELISQFLECIGINLNEKIIQLPEDYLKDCYKHLNLKGLNQ